VERLRLEAAGWLADARRAVEESARGTGWAGLDPAGRREAVAALLGRREEVAVVTLFDRSGRKIRGLQGFPATVAPSEIAEHEVQAGALLRQGLPPAGAAARWSAPYRAARRGEAVMTLLVPLPDRAVGALAAEISLGALQRLATRTRVGARGLALRGGRRGPLPGAPGPGPRPRGGPPSRRWCASSGWASPRRPGGPVAQFRDADGRELLGAWAPMPEVGWAWWRPSPATTPSRRWTACAAPPLPAAWSRRRWRRSSRPGSPGASPGR